MGKKIIIAEKPSVAIEFAKALKINAPKRNGYIETEEYIVTWCVGHLVTMSYPEKYDENLKYWNLRTLPFIPKEYKYEVIKAVETQFNIVKELLTRKDVDTIYVCTDSGREGEYIYRLVDQMAHVEGKIKKRVWIDSQTEEAILKGIKEAKDISFYDGMADAAYLRAKEDYLMGINFSRLLSVIYGKDLAKTLNEDRAAISIGRVMTCVLGMVVEREREIKNFKKVNFYKIVSSFGKSKESSFDAEWKVNEKSKVLDSPKLYSETGFRKKEDAEKFIEYLKGKSKEAVVTEISKKTQKENAPLMYNLAELQNECSKKFKISPDETLQVAQTLYEKKLTTYPRTDARVLSTAIVKEIGKNLNGLVKGLKDDKIQKLLKKMVDEKYSTNIAKTKYVNDAKITDHYCLTPTGQGFENLDKLTDLEKNIYMLIVKRFISIFFPPATYNKVSLTVNVAEETFLASGRVCVDLGYLEVIKDDEKVEEKAEEKNDETKTNLDILKDLKKGDKLNIIEMSIKEGETSPPSRYTSGSMILAMENAGKLIEDEALREQIKGSGIGTSATRAEIIKKLDRINYIIINGKTQVLTSSIKGEEVYNIVSKSIPDLLNPQLTASWEKGLGMVSNNEIKAEEFEAKLNRYVNKKISIFKNDPQFYWIR
ncbi:MAG: DNA topoisomerase [Clostridia bacterium]